MASTPHISRPVSRRWMLLGLLVFMAYLVTVAAIHIDGRNSAARGDKPLLTDFTSLYAASLLAQSKTALDLYRTQEMYQASLLAAQAAYDGKLSEKQARAVGVHPWMYPPPFILLALPLASLPYLLAWLVWLGVTSVPYLLAMRMILQDRSFWLIALGAPPVFFNIMYGQTGFLVAGLIGLGLVWLRSRPVLAGICIGLASIKPHFGLLLPFALIAGAHWKTLWTATATVLTAAVAAGLLFGADTWLAFIGTLMANARGIEQGVFKLSVMTSVLGALHYLGFSMSTAWNGQAVAACLMLAAVIWAWWRQPSHPGFPGLEAAVLCTATLLAVPMAYLYDLMLLVPAIAWLWADMQARGCRPWELRLLIAGSAAILGLREIGPPGSLLAFVFVLLMLLLSMSRLLRARRTADPTHANNTDNHRPTQTRPPPSQSP